MSDEPWQSRRGPDPAPHADPTPPGRVRVGRWDRPKPPHDWRWVVGGIGRTLIATGLLIFGFVAYQLWGTGLQTARAQASLSDDFDELLDGAATVVTVPASTVPASTVPSVAGTSPGTSAGPPARTPLPTAAPGERPPSTPTTAGGGVTASSPATVAPAAIGRPAVGEVLGRIDIPAIGVEDLMMVEGVSREALTEGPGHFPESVLPGQLGNAAIAGHRTTYGAPFADLDDLEAGDEVVVTTLAGTHVYRVTETVIVRPSDYVLVVPTFDPAIASLTLVTCDPPATATKRLVVRAQLDTGRSASVTQPSPTVAPAPSGTADDPLGGAVDGPPTAEPPQPTAAPSASVPDPAATPGASTTATSSGELPDGVADPSAAAFGGGWFEDDEAMPHVAAWGLVLTAVSLGAWALSRRFRRDWVGALAGIVPFAVALYFWFENVNRLLPAGI